jgi:hypothetical protein
MFLVVAITFLQYPDTSLAETVWKLVLVLSKNSVPPKKLICVFCFHICRIDKFDQVIDILKCQYLDSELQKSILRG